MFRKSIALTGLLILCLAHSLVGRPLAASNLPDLKILQYEFVSTNDKLVRVQIANIGKAASRPCQLELAVRKIKGVGATRNAVETIPAIEAGGEEWVTISTSGILQSAISLKEDTTFRLRVDENNVVVEAREDNNEMWHNE
ncbi:MAG TPA: CARDB domain-containing protein [Pyrinomonadaceae bacterium]|nr:CARDB domain-containing protein [Pyrinomonadaceae bacterium]